MAERSVRHAEHTLAIELIVERAVLASASGTRPHPAEAVQACYTYCIYELRFSEDAAARRSSAARLVRQFPPLFDAIANRASLPRAAAVA